MLNTKVIVLPFSADGSEDERESLPAVSAGIVASEQCIVCLQTILLAKMAIITFLWEATNIAIMREMRWRQGWVKII